MNLSRNTLRKMILKEIKLISESVKPKAEKGLLVVGGNKYQLTKGVKLALSSLKNNSDGSAYVVIKKGFMKVGEGTVSKAQVEKIIRNGQKGKTFSIETDQGKLKATPVK